MPRSHEIVRLIEALYQSEYAKMVAYMRRDFPNRGQDLAQDTFSSVYENWERNGLDTVTSPKAYLWTAARRIKLNELRRRHAQKRRLDLELSIDTPSDVDGTRLLDFLASEDELDSPLENYLESEVRQRLRDAISQLSEKLQSALNLYLGGYKYIEISEYLGISVDAVRSRLHEAREKLRTFLSTPGQPNGRKGRS